MKKGIGLKALTVSIALVIVVSGVMPAIAVNVIENYGEVGGIVIFDATHSEDPWRYSDFFSSLEEEGYTVIENYNTVDSSVLSGASIFMVAFGVGYDTPFSPSEITAIDNFVKSGGGLLVVGTDVWGSNDLPYINQITSTYGISFNFDTLCDPTDNTGYALPAVTTPIFTQGEKSHQIWEEVSEIRCSYTNSLSLSESALPIAWGDDDAYTTSPPFTGNIVQGPGTHPIFIATSSIGSGRVVCMGSSIPLSLKINDGDNRQLGINLVDFASSPDFTPVEDALDRYQQRVNQFYDDYVDALAEADAKIYKESGDDSATNVTNYFGYKAGIAGCGSAVPQDLRDTMDEYVRITDFESEIIYNFLKEIYESGNVNQGMSEEDLKSVFYDYYMGTVPGQQQFITGDGGTVGVQHIKDEFNQNFNAAKSAFLENLTSASLSQSEINILVESINTATELVDNLNCLYENDPIIAQAYVDGNLIGLGEYEIKQNPGPGIIFAIPAIGKISAGGKVVLSIIGGTALFTAKEITSTTVSELAVAPTTTAPTSANPNIDHHTIDTEMLTSAGTGKLNELGSDPVSIELIEDTSLNFAIQRQNFLNHVKDSYEASGSIRDALEKIRAVNSLEIIELNVPRISSPDDPGGAIGTGHGYVLIKNNHQTKTLKPVVHIEVGGTSIEGRPADPFLGQIAINDPFPEILPGATENISFDYTVNLVKENHVCTVYDLTVRVVYQTLITPFGVLMLYKGGDRSTRKFIACDESDTALAGALQSFTTTTIAEDCIGEGDSVQHTHKTLSNTERITFSLKYPGSDLDIHIYDSSGNHVGVNYDTGEIENEISGAIYSGSNTNPEWITIENSGGETYTTEIVAMQTIGNESYSLLATETPELPALLGISPSNLTVSGLQGDTIEGTLILGEYGGFNDLNAISITASDLTDGMGGVIPFSSLTFDMPSTDISAASVMIVNLTIDIPTDVVEGRTYSGIITAEDVSGANDTAIVNVVIRAPGNIITVDDSGGADYTKIQDAVSNASSGYTIKVFSGIYNEHVTINKSLKLIGEDKNTTLIDGGGHGYCVHVAVDNVEISGFTIKNGDYRGIYLDSSDNSIIDGNIIYGNEAGIYLNNSNGNKIANNSIFDNEIKYLSGIHLAFSNNNTISGNDIFENDDGVYLYASNNNVITDNNIIENDYGIYVYKQLHPLLASLTSSNNNLIYHNNFINNTEHAYDNTGANYWDIGPTEGGNYWSGHSCTGNPSDGSQPYLIDSDGVDHYPFQDRDGWLKESKPPVAAFTYSPLKPVVNQTVTFDCSASHDPDGVIVEYQLDFGDGSMAVGAWPIWMHSYFFPGNYTVILTLTDNDGNINSTFSRVVQVVSQSQQGNGFDTGSGSYQSISGTFTGTITPNNDISVSKFYTYPCPGTGGHTEYVHIYGNEIDKSASWTGYNGDWHNLTFDAPFTLENGKKYNYEIRTDSYPQIHHTPALQTDNGWINCTKFTDANGKEYNDWIPAIRLFLQ